MIIMKNMFKYPRYVFDSYIGSKWVCFVVMKFGVPTILYRAISQLKPSYVPFLINVQYMTQ